MINLSHYTEDSLTFHQKAIEAKKVTRADPGYKDRVRSLNPAVEAVFAQYDLAFANNTVHALTPIGYTGQQRDDLQKLYSYSSLLLQELKVLLTTTSTNRRRSICANCTISEVNSFDHILPQTAFAEFVVHPKNLLPSCTNCNGRKGQFWVEEGRRLFVNLYLDQVPELQFLHAHVEVLAGNNMTVRFELGQPEGLDDELFGLLSRHYNKLDLLQRFAENADDVVTEFENEINPYTDKVSRAVIEGCVRETIHKNRLLHGLNYWKCVLKDSLLNNEDFMSRFPLLIQAKEL